MATCVSCNSKIGMFQKECDSCKSSRLKEQQNEAQAAAQAREAERQKLIKDEFTRIQVDVKRGLPCFLHSSQYVSIDSEIAGGDFGHVVFDDSSVRLAGLSGWKVVGVMPKTFGSVLTNTSGMNSVWAGGVGGSVIGAYVLLELEVTPTNLDLLTEDILEYLEETV